MFEAIIIACISAYISQGGCITVVDTFGPYTSEAKCESRIEEMKPHILNNVPVSLLHNTPTLITHRCRTFY